MCEYVELKSRGGIRATGSNRETYIFLNLNIANSEDVCIKLRRRIAVCKSGSLTSWIPTSHGFAVLFSLCVLQC